MDILTERRPGLCGEAARFLHARQRWPLTSPAWSTIAGMALLLAAAIRDGSDGRLGMSAVIVDITDLKRQEDRLTTQYAVSNLPRPAVGSHDPAFEA